MIEFTTREVETIHVTLSDDVIGHLTNDHETEIVIATRHAAMTLKLSVDDVDRLKGERP